MNWIEIIVHTTSAGAESVSSVLMDLGASGTQTEDRADIPDPSKTHGIWEIIDPDLLTRMPADVLVHSWFESSDQFPALLHRLEEALDALRHKYPPYGTLQIETGTTPDEDWAESWKKYYHPIRAGKHLIIKPSWETVDALPGDHIIELDPGMAFGSGYHDTTVLCLNLLEKYTKPDMQVIDVGTGSGILAIGAALCGAKEVLAIDIDPSAVQVARQNVSHHDLDAVIRVQEGNLLEQVEESCDLCVTNIIAEVICSFAGPLTSHIRPGGLFLCSGIVLEKKEMVRSALLAAGYEILDELCSEEWAAFAARRGV